VRNAYRGLGGSPKLEAAAEQITAAGGRTTLDQVYRMQSEGTSLQKWQQAIRDRKLSAIPRTIPALTEMTSHPLFEQWVPKIKLGAFTRLAAFDLQKLGPEATELQKIKALQGAWDSIDNRFGQLVYDNLFWPKALKDTGMVGVRALGWYLGTARELGGALYEAGKVPLGMQRQISNKMAYTASLPVVVGLQGALLNYLWTGEAPQSLKDYFYPRTGHIRPDGTPERAATELPQGRLRAGDRRDRNPQGQDPPDVVHSVGDALEQDVRRPQDPRAEGSDRDAGARRVGIPGGTGHPNLDARGGGSGPAAEAGLRTQQALAPDGRDHERPEQHRAHEGEPEVRATAREARAAVPGQAKATGRRDPLGP
jgi:hypothetical protein